MTANEIRKKRIEVEKTIIFIFEIVFLCVFLGLFIWGVIINPSKPTVDYRKTATIFAKYGTLTTVELPDGNLYDFEDKAGECKVGDKVVVSFDDNCSPRDIYDDKIISVERVDN